MKFVSRVVIMDPCVSADVSICICMEFYFFWRHRKNYDVKHVLFFISLNKGIFSCLCILE